MKKKLMTGWIAAIAMAVSIGAPMASAQTGGGAGGTSGGTGSSAGAHGAPIGHRQPRVGDVPSEKGLSNPNDPVNKEDAALDKKIKSICRGC